VLVALFYSYLNTKNKNNAQAKGEATVRIKTKAKLATGKRCSILELCNQGR